MSSIRWGPLSSRAPNSHEPRAVCKFSVTWDSQMLVKHADLYWTQHRFICNSQLSPPLMMPLCLIAYKFASFSFRQNHIARISRWSFIAQTAEEILFK